MDVALVELVGRHIDERLSEVRSAREALPKAWASLVADGRVLVVFDDLPGPDSLGQEQELLPYETLDVDVIVTSNHPFWPAHYAVRQTAPLPTPELTRLVAAMDRDDALSTEERKVMAQGCDGVLVPLLTSLEVVRKDRRRGRSVDVTVVASQMHEKGDATFERPWEALDARARRLLSLAATLPAAGFSPLQLCELAGLEPEVSVFDGIWDLQLVEGDDEHLILHGLLRRWVRARHRPADDDVARVRAALESAARALSDEPGNATHKAAFLALHGGVEEAMALLSDANDAVLADVAPAMFRASSEAGMFAAAVTWSRMALGDMWEGDFESDPDIALVKEGEDASVLGDRMQDYGRSLLEVGRFAEAQTWFERAVTSAERGDVHGRVDRSSVGRSQHQVGYCLSSQGAFAEAQTWYERAVASKERGDVHGRVDPSSVGSSQHQVGCCLSSQGAFAEAQTWFERAVASAERGDVHGRVDRSSVGRSQDAVGYCLSSQGAFAEAQTWYERAVASKERGDVHGRVDPASVGGSQHQVGYCLMSQESFAEAQTWFERAVASTERGDVHGRVDPECVGRSENQVGYCLMSQGAFAEAQTWFERAVASTERGDVHGRVDPESVGSCQDAVGYCLSSQGAFAEAQTWYERAVASKERGDVHGRVDPESVGVSQHQVGYCLSSQGVFAEAQTWYERAVASAGLGDMYGRVDRASIGWSRYLMAQHYEREGQRDPALAMLSDALADARAGDRFGRPDTELEQACLTATLRLQ